MVKRTERESRMTRKDYRLIAEAVNETSKRYNDGLYDDLFTDLIESLSSKLKSDNVHFDRDKFYSACVK